ncbi:MAG: right-handed parallel beta-helix repeat-containing protein, partial [Ignavibacteriales bacterium]|nr:right-handed parallel beta-helix repeat-containing protein [Ignavibacteriales bacterium]
LPSGNLVVSDENGFYVFRPVGTFAGTISVNTIWDGAITISGNTTVSAGVTLTIKPGANITVAPNACLIVDGNLVVEGTSSQPVVMNRSGSSGVWGGIIFNSGSSGTVSYATIRNVSKGIRVTSTAPTIQNCTIESFTEQGIYVINGNSKILTNTINGWSGSARVGTGIYVDNSGLGSSTLEITGNTVKGSVVGIDVTAPVLKLEQNTLGTFGTYTTASSNAYGIVFAGVGTVTNNKTYGDNTNSWGISLAANTGTKSTTFNLLDHHNIGLVDNGFQNGSISRNTFSNNGTGFNNSDGWMTANENNFWDNPSTTYNIANVSTSCPDHTNNYLES